MTLKTMEAHYNTLTDDDVIRMLRNTEGKNEFERGLILEAAKRIEAQDHAIAQAVAAERERCERIARIDGTVSGNRIAAAIRARNGAK